MPDFSIVLARGVTKEIRVGIWCQNMEADQCIYTQIRSVIRVNR